MRYGLLDVWNKFILNFEKAMALRPHIQGLTHIRVVGTCSVSDHLRKENFGLPLCIRASLASEDPQNHIRCSPSDLLHFLYVNKQTGSTIAEFSRSREYNPPNSVKEFSQECTNLTDGIQKTIHQILFVLTSSRIVPKQKR